MSSALTKGRRAAPATLTIPVVSDPVNAMQVNLAFSVIQQYEAGRQARGTQSIPTFAALNLIAPDGSTWQISVAADGTLQTAQVPR
jgi:hypothetical protein